MTANTRRDFLRQTGLGAAAFSLGATAAQAAPRACPRCRPSVMSLGVLVGSERVADRRAVRRPGGEVDRRSAPLDLGVQLRRVVHPDVHLVGLVGDAPVG